MSKKISIKAFSFLEISLVILIIGILIAAFLGGSELAGDAKLRHARTLTSNSPVIGISDLALWLETTSEQSFLKNETTEDSTISRWNDIDPDSSSTSYLSNNSAAANDHPLYKESCINNLPCLYFNGTSGSKISSSKPLGIRTNYISAFFVFTGSENATSSYSSQLFTSDKNAAWNTSSGVFLFTTSTTTPVRFFYNMPGNLGIQHTQCNSSSVLAAKKPYVYSMVDNNSSSIFHYVNGSVANTSGSNNSGLITKLLGTVELGSASYQGNIGEVIIFTKALSTAERKSVEQYLSKKWDIKVVN